MHGVSGRDLGAYASQSEVIRDGLRALFAPDQAGSATKPFSPKPMTSGAEPVSDETWDREAIRRPHTRTRITRCQEF